MNGVRDSDGFLVVVSPVQQKRRQVQTSEHSKCGRSRGDAISTQEKYLMEQGQGADSQEASVATKNCKGDLVI